MNSSNGTVRSAASEIAKDEAIDHRIREPSREIIVDAFRASADAARAEARRLGMPTVGWKDGRSVWEDANGNEVPEPEWARRFRETGEKPPVLHRRVG